MGRSVSQNQRDDGRAKLPAGSAAVDLAIQIETIAAWIGNA